MTLHPRPRIGWLSDVSGVPLFLKGPGLKSHSLIVGQSGSGKSFMLGRLLEEIVLSSEASILILDPNADFVKFSEVEAKVWQRHADAFHESETLDAFQLSWNQSGFVVLSTRAADQLALTHPFATVERPALAWPSFTLDAATILGLDTALHVEEIFAVNDIQQSDPEPKTLDEFLKASEEQWRKRKRSADASVYLRAAEINALPIWSKEGQAATVAPRVQSLLSGTARVVCMDIASLESDNARLMIVGAALEALWKAAREAWFDALRGKPEDDKRKPVFVVIDEAHNLAPSTTAVAGPARRVSDLLARIATEGRKYGIYLVMVTQRPSRLDETLRTQCDNLFLLKMNDRHDLQLIEQSFGFIPQGWAQRAMEFKQGDLLLGGTLVDRPVYARTGPRRTVEGGRSIRDTAWLPYLREKQ